MNSKGAIPLALVALLLSLFRMPLYAQSSTAKPAVFSEAQYREVYIELVGAQGRAEQEADKTYPSNAISRSKLETQLEAKYIKAVLAKHGLGPYMANYIFARGMKEGWPSRKAAPAGTAAQAGGKGQVGVRSAMTGARSSAAKPAVLSEAQYKEVYIELVGAQGRAEQEADRTYPSDARSRSKLEAQLEAKYVKAVLAKHGLGPYMANYIFARGLREGWPSRRSAPK